MSKDDAKTDRAEVPTRPKLPVTAEVGGEGGSYGDPTVQVATTEGDIPRVENDVDDRVRPDFHESDTAEGMRKYPTDR